MEYEQHGDWEQGYCGWLREADAAIIGLALCANCSIILKAKNTKKSSILRNLKQG